MARNFRRRGDYRTLLDRKDVDAVLVATSDHHHRRVTLDAVAAGKDVYCEKPMSHSVEDGFAMLEAVQANKRIFQAGSQRVSSILYAKAREIFASGRLGEVHEIDAQWNRNSPGGAWVYPIPPDASPETVDWKGFLVDAPDRPFDAEAIFPVALLQGLRFGAGRGFVCAPAQRHSGDYRNEYAGQPRLLDRRGLPLQRRPRVP